MADKKMISHGERANGGSFFTKEELVAAIKIINGFVEAGKMMGHEFEALETCLDVLEPLQEELIYVGNSRQRN